MIHACTCEFVKPEINTKAGVLLVVYAMVGNGGIESEEVDYHATHEESSNMDDFLWDTSLLKIFCRITFCCCVLTSKY